MRYASSLSTSWPRIGKSVPVVGKVDMARSDQRSMFPHDAQPQHGQPLGVGRHRSVVGSNFRAPIDAAFFFSNLLLKKHTQSKEDWPINATNPLHSDKTRIPPKKSVV